MTAPRLFAVISSAQFGGAERCFATLLSGLKHAGIGVEVVAPESGPMLPEYARDAAKLHRLDLSRVYDPTTVVRLAGLIRESGVRLVHTHLWNADVLGGAAALHASVPAIVSTIYGPYHLPLSAGGWVGLRRRALSFSYRAVYRGFTSLIAVSEYIKRDLLARPGLKAGRHDIEVIYPPAGGPPRTRASSAKKTGKVIVCVANFDPVKGQETLVRAMLQVRRRVPGSRCILIGDGPGLPQTKALVSKLGLEDSIAFTGATLDPSVFLAEADVFAFPSLSEGFGMAPVEAGRHGLPVVASRVGGIPESVVDEETGLLVPPGDPPSLAEALVKVLSDEALARRLGEAGQRRAAARFSSGEMLERTLAHLRRSLPSGSGLPP